MNMNGLVKKKCVPCDGGVPPFTKEKAKEYLLQVDGWELIEESRKIQKTFKFNAFFESVSFFNKIAAIMEIEGHHANVFVNYNKVTLTIYTHKINGLHENDFILAAKIDQIIKK